MPLGIPDDELPMQQREAEESQRMTEQEMNVAIAEACGWTRFKTYEVDGRAVQYGFPPGSPNYYESPLPDYTRDLSAMHEAEKLFTVDAVKEDWKRWDKYRKTLDEMVGDEDAFHATALQRAEAFLRTINQFTPTPTPEHE